MEALTWSLFSVCLCIQVTQTDGSSWTAKVPSSVKGLLGSCVIIPCSFDYPQPENKQVTEYTGIWNDDAHHPIYHPVKENILENYRDRTTLLGDVRHKNCTLKIDDIRSSDRGPFHFRIELKDYDKFSFLQNKVSISVIDESQPITLSMDEEISEGQSVSPSCSVFYSCPTSPPVFTWSYSGEQRFHSQELSDGQWKATSTLTFRPTRADHNKPLQCSVQMHNGKPLQTQSTVLQVKYGPEIKNASSCSSEGDMIKCVCMAESNPPSMIHFVLPNKVHLSTKVEKHGSLTIGTLQVNIGSSMYVHCLANNTQGSANVMLSLPVKSNMLYIYIAAGAAGGLVILVAAVIAVKKCRRRSGDTPEPDMSTTKEDKEVELSASQYATTQRQEKRIETYDDVGCQGIYSNDHIYGNMEDDEDDAIYANM